MTVHAKAGESCLDCHTAELTTQISEVCAWVSDNYPMTEDGTMLATGKQFASEEFCARAECHGGKSFDEITAGLWGFCRQRREVQPAFQPSGHGLGMRRLPQSPREPGARLQRVP